MFAILMTSSLFASPANDPANLRSALTAEITSHIIKLNLADVTSASRELKIQFMVNDKNELVILRTNNEDLDGVVKSNLNYKMLKTQDVDRNTVYSIKVNITE